jgi:ribosomal protein S18 acetylase RimI-like enzyme
MHQKKTDPESGKKLLQEHFFNNLKEASLRGFPFFESSEYHFCFADDSNPVAALLSRKIEQDLTEIDFIAVKEEQRGKGLAKALVQSLEGSVWLEVNAENAKAIGFYKAIGFSCVGRRKGYYGHTDAILMEKKP